MMRSDMAEDLSYPCQQVVNEGALCGMPCDPGFTRCKEHRSGSDKRALSSMLDQAQERVLRRLDGVLDDAVGMLINLVTNARSEHVRLMAIDKMLTLLGFANLRIDAGGPGMVESGDRDKVLIELVKNYARDPEALKQLEAKIEIIDAEVIGEA